MRIEGTFLNSRVARRTFLYFCAAALAPSLLLSALAYQAAQDSFRIAAGREVVAASKSFALRVFERIDTAALLLEGAADRAVRAREGPDETTLSALFVHVRPVRDAEPAVADALRAAMAAAGDPRAATGTRHHRLRSRLLVLPATVASDPPQLFLVQESLGDVPSWIVGQLRPGYVWGEPDELQAGHPTCAYADRNQRLFCSRQPSAEVTGDGPSNLLTGEWTLFLKARFGASSWTFRTYVPRPSVRTELPELAHTIVWVWLGTVLLVALLSLRIIRKTMVPLEALIAQTRRIPTASFSPSQRGHDEFGQLATAFDEMGLLVARQLGTLNALSELDRKILKREELREVIDLVLGRIQRLVPDAVVCVIVHPSAAAEWQDLYVRPVGEEVTRRCRIRRAAGAAHTAAPGDWGPWTPLAREGLAEPSATLFGHGARHGAGFRLEIGDRVCGSVSLGMAGDARPSGDCLHEVHELGSRIATAIAAKEREDQLVHQARHDVLTGLPNRFAAQEMLASAIAHAAPLQQPFAVLFFDLDGFKAINDGLGHVSGDRVLMGAASLLSRSVGEADFVARLGGDEFLVMLADGASEEAAMSVADHVIAALSQPVFIDGVELLIGASVGIAMFPKHGTDTEALIRNADIAMYQAKSAGGNRGVLFEDRMNTDAADRVQLESDLRQAIQLGEIGVQFQPVLDCRTGAIVAAEALARWQHPLRGAVSPATFIPIAESSALIETLDRYVLETACREFAAWKRGGHALARIAVNVSSRQLRSENFVTIVRAVLAHNDMRGSELEIEVTESVLVADLAVAAARLEAVRQLGVSIAIDDFGTGYSSLAYLKSLPVDTLKIDREFIVDMAESAGALALVRAIVAMGHATGKTLVAEGVESGEQVELLRVLGCHNIQGFFYHRPMSAEALSLLLAAAHRVGGDAMTR